MRYTWSLSAASCLLSVTMAVPLLAQTPAPKEGTNPCWQVEGVCKKAGFIDKGTNVGKGLWSDCIEPIMQGKPQTKAAKLPLPEVSPQLVAACKAKDPSYGEGGKPKPKQ
jgi:hypothetical protein